MKGLFKTIKVIGGILFALGGCTMDSVSAMSIITFFAGLALMTYGAWKEEMYAADGLQM